MSAPAAFRAELRSHNRHATGIAVLAFFAAVVAWNLAYFFFVLILLGLVTSVRGDFLLLPVRITFAIWGNLSAIRRLSPEELDRAWELLTTIHRARQAKISALSVFEPDPDILQRLLGTLQLLGYIDLHPGQHDWFYTVCSPREPELRALTAE